MKKIMLFIALVVASFCAFSADRQRFYKNGKLLGMYVDSKEGLNVRNAPSLSGKKIAGLMNGDFVIPVELGDTDIIDGKEDYWVKILLYPEQRYWKHIDEYGWVFGAYISKYISDYHTEELRQQIKQRGFNHSNNFCDDYDTNYMIYTEDDEFAKFRDEFSYYDVGCWRDKYPYFDRALPNLLVSTSEKRAYTVKEAFFLDYNENPLSEHKEQYRTMRLLPPFSVVELSKIVGYGIDLKTKTLYPIYEAWASKRGETVEPIGKGRIRGIDIASVENASIAKDGKNGDIIFVYQKALTNVNDRCGTSIKNIERELNDKETYDRAYINGMTENTAARFMSNGISHNVELKGFLEYGDIRLLYPLNMENPVPILQHTQLLHFNDPEFPGTVMTRLYTLNKKQTIIEPYAIAYFQFETRAASSFKINGFSNHFFCDSRLFVYEYQTEYGKTTKSQYTLYEQDKNNPYKFKSQASQKGEPKPKRKSNEMLKVGDYVNPICRVKMRSEPSTEKISSLLGTLEAGTLLRIVEIGEEVKIDGIKSNWVKAESVNSERFVDGNVVNKGWVFGGYLY